MRTFVPPILATLSVAVAACGSGRGPTTVEWRGQVFREVRTLVDLPPAIRSGLGGNGSGLDAIADRGGCFNATDVVHDSCPMRRFVVAGTDGEAWLVALEQGGRGYHVQVLLFSSPAGAAPNQKWVLFERPAALKDVVRQISKTETSP
jgi:hypothetical protein